ncbi:hypothetical protein [Treponema sp. R80B11-R83G3]
MTKKIAFFLIFIMLFNMVAWADDDVEEEATTWIVIGVVGLVVCTLSLILLIADVAETDTPDDGIRLTSMQGELNDRITSNPVLNLLQHVNFGYSAKNDKVFAGLRFQF